MDLLHVFPIGLNVAGWIALLVGCYIQYWLEVEDPIKKQSVINVCDVKHAHRQPQSEFVVCDVDAVCKVCNFVDYADDLCDNLHSANIRHTEITICSSDTLCKVCVFNYTYDGVCSVLKHKYHRHYDDVIICSPDEKCQLCNFTIFKDDQQTYHNLKFDYGMKEWLKHHNKLYVAMALVIIFLEYVLIMVHVTAVCHKRHLPIPAFYCGMLVLIYIFFSQPLTHSWVSLVISAVCSFLATVMLVLSDRLSSMPEY